MSSLQCQRLVETGRLPFRRIETEPGQEAQVGFAGVVREYLNRAQATALCPQVLLILHLVAPYAYVLNEIQSILQVRTVQYWRDKRGHEVDFVYSVRGHAPTAIECKWSAGGVDPWNLQAFRRQYPAGQSYVVANDVTRSYQRNYGDIEVRFVSLPSLVAALRR